jgi:DNA-directed RNA polymerase specialized sigma24 family protein
MKMSNLRYFKLEDGRVGYINPQVSDSIAMFTYGEARAPGRDAVVTILSDSDGQQAFAEQQTKMWHRVQSSIGLATKLARRFVGDEQAAEELVSEVGIRALGYAAVRHDPILSAWQTYARQVLTHAYANKLDLERRHRLPHDDSREPENIIDDKDPQADLMNQDRLYGMGLSADEVELLIARFVDKRSARDLAVEMGVTSPTTVIKRINKILARCQEVQQKQSTPQSEP